MKLSKRDIKRIVKQLRKTHFTPIPGVKVKCRIYGCPNPCGEGFTVCAFHGRFYKGDEESQTCAKRDSELEKHRVALDLPDTWECSLILSKNSEPTKAEALIDPNGETWRRESESQLESELVEVYEGPVEFRGKRVKTLVCDDDSIFTWRDGTWHEVLNKRKCGAK